VFEVVVWGTPETRHNLSSIRDFLLETPKGPPVRLGELAEVRVVPSPTVIRHEAISPSVDVVANVRGSDPGVVAREVEQRLKEVKFPLEVHPELLGEYAERQAAQRRMLSFAIAAAVGIFLLLQASVRSWRLASLVFLTLPVALAGGVLAALAFGGTVSLGSIVGFLAVFGIAARTSIMLIRHCQDLERHEGEPFGAGLVLRATHELFLPIVMTAVTTGLALLPLVLFGDAAGLEIVRPMVIVILGGLVVSTLVNLFVVPALYLRFGAQREPDLELLPAPAVRAGMPSSA
jgi:Cu/Ag efflux pump CusA